VAQQGPQGLVERMEHHQVVIYLAAMAAGALLGWAAPGLGPGLEHAINPVLGALLFVTFLQAPAAELVRSLRDGRFLSAAVVVNFVVVPLVVAAMFAFLPGDQAVRLGVLLVLLCPCVDYVIVFSGLAGGSSRRLLAATPVLLVAQMLLLPGFLYLFMGSELADIVEVGPFLEAFVGLIVIPLALAWALQAWAARRPAGQKVSEAARTWSCSREPHPGDLTHALAGRGGPDHAASGGLGPAADREAGAGHLLAISHGITWRRVTPLGTIRCRPASFHAPKGK